MGLNLKYEHLGAKFDSLTLHAIRKHFTYCSYDYNMQMRYYAAGVEAFNSPLGGEPSILSYNQLIREKEKDFLREPTILEFYETEIEKKFHEQEELRKQKTREEQSKRIKEAMQKRREQKKQQQREALQIYERALEIDEELARTEEIQRLDFESEEELIAEVKKLRIKLGLINKNELSKDKYSLIEKPDSELTPREIKTKRMQIMHKQAGEQRKLMKQKKQQEKERIDKLKSESPEAYLKFLHKKRNVRDFLKVAL